jgi:DNA-binding XRE family transcriptional regulator
MFDAEDVRLMPACRKAWTGNPWSPASQPRVASIDVTLGRRMRRLRIERGWSRQTVATQLGISMTRVESHERGKRRIEARELVAYVRLYGLTIGDLFRDLPTDGNGEW